MNSVVRVHRIIGTLGVVLALVGCATVTPGSGDSWIDDREPDPRKTLRYEVGSVAVDGFFDPAPIEEDVGYVLDVIFSEANARKDVVRDSSPIVVDVQVSQQRIVERYLSKNAINIELVGRIEGEESPLFRSFYAADTQNTVESYADLQRVLRRALRYVIPFTRRL